ncbi:MAG TPA: DUF3097 family protein [Acidimicrobiales bacterium]|nr:DUF3097 family protein [Acidimicrobiales bacterium]
MSRPHRYAPPPGAEPLDLDGPRRRRTTYPEVEARPGLVAQQRGTPFAGAIIEANTEAVLLRDRRGDDHWVRYTPGGFEVDGAYVTLVPPRVRPGDARRAPTRTTSGSIAVEGGAAKVARASRILVEGQHDAELVEKVWGDDLRVEGVVVEELGGADHLAEVVRTFGPRPGRRLGILLDHLVDGSKETRLAAAVDHPDVLVVGHPFVDIWQAVKPGAIGADTWPAVPIGEPWKEGVLARLGVQEEPGRFWKRLLGSVSSWTDLEPALIGAVEQLIDFVTVPAS